MSSLTLATLVSGARRISATGIIAGAMATTLNRWGHAASLAGCSILLMNGTSSHAVDPATVRIEDHES